MVPANRILILVCLIQVILCHECRQAEKRKSTTSSSKLPVEMENIRRATMKCMNQYRNVHGVQPLKHSKNIERIAQNYAQRLANQGQFRHSQRSGYGENLYSYHSSGGKSPKDAAACHSWYQEERDYNYKTGKGRGVVGHFTQMLWKNTTHAGVGVSRRNGRYVVVVNYWPPGNVIGQYTKNVLPPKWKFNWH